MQDDRVAELLPARRHRDPTDSLRPDEVGIIRAFARVGGVIGLVWQGNSEEIPVHQTEQFVAIPLLERDTHELVEIRVSR